MIHHPLLIKKTAKFQTKQINPASTEQTYTPDSGYDGFSSVKVSAVDSSVDSNIQPAYIKKGISILGVAGTFEGSASDQPSVGKSSIIVSATTPGGKPARAAEVTITKKDDTSVVYKGSTDANGRFYLEVYPGVYTIAVNDREDFITPDAKDVEASVNEANYVYMAYTTTSVTYGIKIDLANSNPETSVTYTDDAVDSEKSYMDFTNDTFVWGSWKDRFPFNMVKPCLFKNGAVVKYLNPDDYTKDVDGNDAVITGADGDVMIEIPKVYYRLHKDANYQYIQISDTPQDGFCCLAHTYKGVEKDKVYIGAYQSYYDGTSSRSVSGVSATGSVSLNTWRTYSRNKGEGYENFYWDLLVLLQCLYAIQFKNLDSQTALGYGWCNGSGYSTGGGLNQKGLYYGKSTHAQMKFMGIEDFYGSRLTWIDGAYINSSRNLTTIDSTNASVDYNGSGTGYTDRGYTLSSTSSGYTKKIMGENASGFVPNDNGGSASTYYCDRGRVSGSGSVPYFGGTCSNTTNAGAFYLGFGNSAADTSDYFGGRLAFCG